MPEVVTVFETGPRDGLQNEKRPIPTADKIRLVDLLTACGFAKIEVASFVSPRWVPQMADGADVLAGIARGRAKYAALTPNLQGYQRARAAKVDEVAIFASASEGFSRANINASIDESLARFAPLVEAARADSVPVRGYVSCAVVCPYDGPTPPASVRRVTKALLDMGCYEVALSDTVGQGTPESIGAMLEGVLDLAPVERFAAHLHDTNGRALENIAVCLDHGLHTFDSAVAGLGGCPYAPGARGNVATEAVVDLLESRGFATGIDRARLAEAAAFATTLRSPDREP
jgi:hydroxymethylglutaryl-CoA lyase